MYSGYLTDIEGIEVGHAMYEEGQTGVTTILCKKGATAGCDVRGSAPGTRETAYWLLKKWYNKYIVWSCLVAVPLA